MAEVLTVARPLKKHRREMKQSELHAADAEKEFNAIRIARRNLRTAIKKDVRELSRITRSINKQKKLAAVKDSKLWAAMLNLIKKRIRDSLSLKKETSYTLPLGVVPLSLSIEVDLWELLEEEIRRAAQNVDDVSMKEETVDADVATYIYIYIYI